jgi:nitroreductase
LNVIDAIKKRRSIRRFKSAQITHEQIKLLLEAARLAPSGSNVQPWRFLIVKDQELKNRLQEACFNQELIGEASVIIVCCGDLLSWKETRERNQEIISLLQRPINKDYENVLMARVDRAASVEITERIPTTMMNVAIAIEHIVLEAVELSLGSCWVRIFDERKIRELFDLPEYILIVAILAIGVPDERPEPRPRLPLSSIVIPIKEKGVG